MGFCDCYLDGLPSSAPETSGNNKSIAGHSRFFVPLSRIVTGSISEKLDITVDGKIPRQLKKTLDRFRTSENPRGHDHAFRQHIDLFQNLVSGFQELRTSTVKVSQLISEPATRGLTE
jgi:hypothetical protein